MRDFGGREERNPWSQELEREKKKILRKLKENSNWSESEVNQHKTTAKMELVDQTKPGGNTKKNLDPLGRI